VQPAVHKASTVIFENVAALRARDWKQKSGYTYGLHGTPTSFTLEERIATLEGGLQTLIVPSGLAAITLVDMSLLSAGDEVLLAGERLRSRQGTGAQRAGPLGHRPSLLRSGRPPALAAMIGRRRSWSGSRPPAR
jgi:cystathionine beta-lyase